MRIFLLIYFVFSMPCLALADVSGDYRKLVSAGYAVADGSGKVIEGSNTNDRLVPASTTKLVTAWLALKHWGAEHRFQTEIFLDRDTKTLWIKGGGDPFLVSEELVLIARKIASLKPPKIAQIVLDSSLFTSDLVVPGATTTNNPYDAVPTAIAANFNTVYLKVANGAVISAEPQTPLTAFASGFAKDIKGSSLRVNTGRSSRQSEQYFAELLVEFLRMEGVQVEGKIVWGKAPGTQADVVHANSRTLGEIIQAMLKYSTNFIANQIILTLVAEEQGRPADFSMVRDYMHDTLADHFGWAEFNFVEGAGLSVNNKISSQQLIDLLVEFKPWRHLLDEVEPGVFAKTGTLTNVSSLAGYFDDQDSLRIFAILINESVPAAFTRQLAVELSAR